MHKVTLSYLGCLQLNTIMLSTHARVFNIQAHKTNTYITTDMPALLNCALCLFFHGRCLMNAKCFSGQQENHRRSKSVNNV